jgi:hypothetical protein
VGTRKPQPPNLTAERLKELANELQLIKVSCADQEGTRTGRVQTWDGKVTTCAELKTPAIDVRY